MKNPFATIVFYFVPKGVTLKQLKDELRRRKEMAKSRPATPAQLPQAGQNVRIKWKTGPQAGRSFDVTITGVTPVADWFEFDFVESSEDRRLIYDPQTGWSYWGQHVTVEIL